MYICLRCGIFGSHTTRQHDCNSDLCTSICTPTSNCLLQYSYLISVMLIVTYLLYQCQQQRRRLCCNTKHCRQKLVQLFVMIAIPGLLIALYEVMLLVQVQIGSAWRKRIASLPASVTSTVCTWMVIEVKVSEESKA